MGELTVSDHTLTFEQISEDSADRSYVLTVEYGRRYVDATSTDRVPLSVSDREAVTRDVVEDALEEWFEAESDVTIRSYEVLETIECRRGELEDVERDVSTSNVPEGKPVPGVDARTLTQGDRVAYYVGGPGHDIYGYISEGIVEDVPPWSRSPHRHSETVTDAARLDVGGRTKEIPLAWIVGPVDSEEIADAVDRPRDSLGE